MTVFGAMATSFRGLITRRAMKAAAYAVGCCAIVAGAAASDTSYGEWEAVSGGVKYIDSLAASSTGEGDVWFSGLGGIGRLIDGRWRVVSQQDRWVDVIAIDDNGETGWASNYRDLMRLADGTWSAVTAPEEVFVDLKISGEALFTLTTSSHGFRLWRHDDNAWFLIHTFPFGQPITPFFALDVVGRDIWVAGGYDVYRCREAEGCSKVVADLPYIVRDIDMHDNNYGWAVGGECSPVGLRGLRGRMSLYMAEGVWSTHVEPSEPGLATVVSLSESEAVTGGFMHQAGRFDKAAYTPVKMDRAPFHLPLSDDCTQCRCTEGGFRATVRHGDVVYLAGGGHQADLPGSGAFILKVGEGEPEWVLGHHIDRVAASGPSVWRVADGDVWRLGDDGWNRIELDLPNMMADIHVSDNQVVAVGADGWFARLRNGAWMIRQIEPIGDLIRVVMDAEDHGYIVGRGSQERGYGYQVFEIDGDSVTEVLFRPGRRDWLEDWPYDATLHAGALWIAGKFKVIHGRPGAWVEEETPIDRPSAIAGGGDNLWLAAGAHGLIDLNVDLLTRSRDGLWVPETRYEPGLDEYAHKLKLFALHVVSDADVWAAGVDSNVIHFTGDVWRHVRRFGEPGQGHVYNEWQMRSIAAQTTTKNNELIEDRTILVGGDSDTLFRMTYRVPGNGDTTKEHILYLPQAMSD
jgi:hypothetical protein